MRGVHIRALQELLGHKTLDMTRRYSHLAPEQLPNAVKLLDGVIGEKRELVGCETTGVSLADDAFVSDNIFSICLGHAGRCVLDCKTLDSPQ